ncbi:MAG: FliH/SctL family protein [Myxococcota bacterium]
MSSFKPDPFYADLAFRPLLFGAGGEAAFGGGAFAREERVAPQPVAMPAPEPAVPACTEADHAELEEAAFEKGRASAAAEWARCEQACAVLEAAAAEMARVSVRMLHANREQMVALASEIARLWIGEELRLDPARFAGPLERALAQCAEGAEARVRLNPAVLSALETSLPERVAGWSESLAVELVSDPGLAPDAFRIESGPRTLDADLDGLVGRVREAVREAFESAGGEGDA